MAYPGEISDDEFLRAFLDALQAGSQGTAYLDAEMGDVVIDGRFDRQVLLDALTGDHLDGPAWESRYRL